MIVGCTTQLDAVLDFSDAMIFAMALANVLGLYLLAPLVKRDLDAYWLRVNASAVLRLVVSRLLQVDKIATDIN